MNNNKEESPSEYVSSEPPPVPKLNLETQFEEDNPANINAVENESAQAPKAKFQRQHSNRIPFPKTPRLFHSISSSFLAKRDSDPKKDSLDGQAFADILQDEAETEEEEEVMTAEEKRKIELERKLKQAKKLENFFIKTDVPPRPKLERSRVRRKDWKFDIENDWLDRSGDPNFLNCKQPFSVTFHIAWSSFFFCFMGWFALGPIEPLLLQSGFTKSDVNLSNTLALASTIIIRFIVGPLCERYGSKVVMVTTLFFGGLLVCLTSTATTGQALMVSRFFVGMIGGSFVPCQFWISMMYSTKIVGFMSGSAAGFGNAGAGVIVFVMGALVSGFQSAGYSADQTWRYSLLIPGFMMMLYAIPTYVLPSDCPQGSWDKRKYGTPADRIGRMTWLKRTTATKMNKILSLEQTIQRSKFWFQKLYYRLTLIFITEEKLYAFRDWRAWVVGVQYAFASGIELSILSGLTSYYTFEFGCEGNITLQVQEKALFLNNSLNSTGCFALDTTSAAFIAAIFGLTNLYGRMLGGGFSDLLARSKGSFHGVRGRHLAIFISILLEGGLMISWSSLTDWPASAGFLILFSSSVHVAKGAVIGIAPFVNPGSVGAVMGVVSAVGNLGGVLMSLMYAGFATSREVYFYQGIICMFGSLTAFVLKVQDLEANKEVWFFSCCNVEPDLSYLKGESGIISRFRSSMRPSELPIYTVGNDEVRLRTRASAAENATSIETEGAFSLVLPKKNVRFSDLVIEEKLSPKEENPLTAVVVDLSQPINSENDKTFESSYSLSMV